MTRARRTRVEWLFVVAAASTIACLVWYFASGSRTIWTYLWLIVSASAAIALAYRGSPDDADRRRGPQGVVADMTSRVLPRRRR